MRFSRTAATLAAAATLVAAQTYTNCNPTKKTCPNDIGLDSSSYSANFVNNPTANASWTAADYTTITYGNNGAEFSIAEQGQAPTISTDFYFFFGRVDVTMKAAPGTGIVSSIVFESDDLDEIDWEFLGGNTAQVETNFFGKGNTTVYDRAVYYSVTEPQSEFHTYTVDWTSERIAWIIDGVTVRTLAYTDPLTNGGKNYPQTPMRLKLGNWCGGCSGEAQGTIEWAGGNTTFNNAPYVMYVKSVAIQNYNPGSAYKYSDESGDWQSIEIVAGNGSKSSPTGSGSSAPATASATGVASNNSNHTSAPTSKVPVSAIQNTAAAVTSTVTGSSYSMNTASAFAANSVVTATTQVPSSPSSNVTSSATPAAQTGTNGAAIANAFTGVSLLSAVAAFFFL